MALFLMVTGLLNSAGPAQAADGDLDPSFGTGGTVTGTFSAADSAAAQDVAVQPDGKIVTVGYVLGDADAEAAVAIARYETDGELDMSFGTDGTVIAEIGRASAVAIDPDGRILVAGAGLARYDAHGDLDLTFGDDGMASLPLWVYDMTLQPDDGKIVVAGTDLGDPECPYCGVRSDDFAVARYNSDGTPDSNFGIGGEVTTNIETGTCFSCDSMDYGRGVALDSEQRIVVAGVTVPSSTNRDVEFALVRYTPSGTLDPTFGTAGIVTTDVSPGYDDGANDVALQGDGKIIAVGGDSYYSAFFGDFALARYNPDGTLDTSFGTGGTVVTAFGSGVDKALAVALQPGGAILAAGSAQVDGQQDFALARYSTDGTLDPTFGTPGKLVTDIAPGDPDEQANALALQSDGKIVAAGRANDDFALARYGTGGDTTAPDTTITLGPSDPSASADAIFEFSSDESGSTFECSLDGGGFGICASPKTYEDLADGEHQFEVKATDAARNSDATPAERTWTIDTTSPQTTITSGPADPSVSPEATFEFTASESGSAFACSLDGAAFTSCASPKAYSGLADGEHTFRVRATDAAGNTDTSPATRTWTIDTPDPDTTPPETTITSGPSGWSRSSSATFEFASDEVATFSCGLDGEPLSACSSPKSYSGLAQGDHTFRVVARDAAGNVDPSPAQRGFTVDTVAPDTSIVSGPDGPTNSATATFVFASTASGSTFACSLDGGAFQACQSPKSYSGLGNGSHTFGVRATDPAGNTDPTPASRSWTIDTTPPDTTITSAPRSPSSLASPSFAFISSENGSTFGCSLDGGPFTPCVSPKAYDGLSEGAHTVEVRAVDTAGNQDPTPARHTWTIDLHEPETSLTSGPSGTVTSPEAAFTFESESGASFRCSLDGGVFTGCSSPHPVSGLRDGVHTFRVRAIDPAGNVDSTPAERVWTVDAEGPVILLQRPTYGIYVNDQRVVAEQSPYRVVVGSVTVEARVSDAESGIAPESFRFEVNGTPVAGQVSFQDGVYRFTFQPPSLGQHTITARATNGSGIPALSSIQVLAIPT